MTRWTSTPPPYQSLEQLKKRSWNLFCLILMFLTRLLKVLAHLYNLVDWLKM